MTNWLNPIKMEINMSAIDENITKYENWLIEVEKAWRELKDQLANLTVNKAIYRSALYTLREMKQKVKEEESVNQLWKVGSRSERQIHWTCRNFIYNLIVRRKAYADVTWCNRENNQWIKTKKCFYFFWHVSYLWLSAQETNKRTWARS